MKQVKDLKIVDKWEEGIDVRDEASTLSRLIGEVDFHHYSDSFWFRFGGDGDNGETLAYIIDDLIEHGLIEVKILENSDKGSTK